MNVVLTKNELGRWDYKTTGNAPRRKWTVILPGGEEWKTFEEGCDWTEKDMMALIWRKNNEIAEGVHVAEKDVPPGHVYDMEGLRFKCRAGWSISLDTLEVRHPVDQQECMVIDRGPAKAMVVGLGDATGRYASKDSCVLDNGESFVRLVPTKLPAPLLYTDLPMEVRAASSFARAMNLKDAVMFGQKGDT